MPIGSIDPIFDPQFPQFSKLREKPMARLAENCVATTNGFPRVMMPNDRRDERRMTAARRRDRPRRKMNRERRGRRCALARSEFAATTYARHEAEKDRKRREKVDRERPSGSREGKRRGSRDKATARGTAEDEPASLAAASVPRVARGRLATLTRSSG